MSRGCRLGWDDGRGSALFHVSHSSGLACLGCVLAVAEMQKSRGKHARPLGPRLNAGTLSVLLHFVGQSRSRGQPRFKEWGSRFPLFSEKSYKGIYKGSGARER